MQQGFAAKRSGVNPNKVMNTSPAIVVLAAGQSSRFEHKEHKLMQPLGSGTVLGRTIGHAVATGLPLVVVTTERLASEAARWVPRRDLVVLPEMGSGSSQPLGMGFSIASGVAARSHANGWLMLPGDMPMVRPATLLAVARALDQHLVAYAQHHGRRGHPVGFSAELYSELVQLSGDEGARRLLARYPSVGLEVADPGALMDVDTLADLERARRLVDEVADNPRP